MRRSRDFEYDEEEQNRNVRNRPRNNAQYHRCVLHNDLPECQELGINLSSDLQTRRLQLLGFKLYTQCALGKGVSSDDLLHRTVRINNIYKTDFASDDIKTFCELKNNPTLDQQGNKIQHKYGHLLDMRIDELQKLDAMSENNILYDVNMINQLFAEYMYHDSYYANGKPKQKFLPFIDIIEQTIGRYTSYYENGRTQETYTVDDQDEKHGKYESFYENGDLKEMSFYYNGKRHGLYAYWNPISTERTTIPDNMNIYQRYSGLVQVLRYDEHYRDGITLQKGTIPDDIFIYRHGMIQERLRKNGKNDEEMEEKDLQNEVHIFIQKYLQNQELPRNIEIQTHDLEHRGYFGIEYDVEETWNGYFQLQRREVYKYNLNYSKMYYPNGVLQEYKQYDDDGKLIQQKTYSQAGKLLQS